MSVNSKMTAIADGIRAKTGKTEKLTLDQMAIELSTMSVEEIIKHAEIPDYVKSEALRVASLVEAAKKDDSIVFLAMSDSHHCGDQTDTGWRTNQNAGNWHAVQAAKVLSYALDMDFVCHLGDLTFGHGTTTSALLHQQIEEMTSWLDESQTGIPTFMSVGNHDTGMYAVNEGTESSLESASYLFSIFGARCEGATYGSTEYGYCYRDFEDKKLRVICLNSSERDTTVGYGANPAMSDIQLLWFAQTLKTVGSKTGWNVITLSHYPLDFATCVKASDVVKAYVTRSSITLNGTAVNFSGSNNAKFVAAFHGHTHCFKYARLNTVSNKVATEYDAMRIAVPGSGFYRNNHQPEADGNGISFKDDITYDKTVGVKDTAFVVNVINPTDKVVHSFCYGAGVDRAIGYGDIVWYKITKTLANCALSNNASSIENGKPYVAEITPNEHCAVTSITITMGGVDITNTAYSNNSINIAQVTGEVVITVKAEIALACTNQIPISTDASGNIYNGKGYRERYYADSAGNDSANNTTDFTGFMPCKIGDVIRLQDMPLPTTVTNCRLYFYTADKTFIGFAQVASSWYMDTLFKGVKDENGNYIQLTIASNTVTTGCAYIRISAADITESSIVTINEEIRYADEVGETYSVVYNLSNVISGNNSAVVVENEGYSSTLTATSGYTLDSVTVTMGGTDITSSAYSNGNISISKVTGDIIITATAVESTVTPTYTNQIPISVDADGNIYNGKGFKENTYLSSGNEGSKTGYTSTGFMKVTQIPTVVRLKNAGWDTTDDYCRVMAYNPDKTYKTGGKASLWAEGGVNAGSCERDENGNVIKMSITSYYTSAGGYIRFCGDGINANTIITFDEEID